MYYRVEYISRGKKLSSIVNANNKIEASALVKKENKGVIVVGAKETAAPIEETFANWQNSFASMFKPKLNIDDKIAFIRQVATMTDAGIPIHDVLEDIVKNSKNKLLQKILSSVANDINAGKSMSQALMPYKDQMGHIVMAMTELGEKTGNFPEAYHELADILEKMRDNQVKFKKAMRYPKMVIVALIAAFVAVIMLVVPNFRKIFEELHTDLPLATRILLGAESFFREYGLYIIVALVAIFFIQKHFYKNNENYRYKVDKILAHPKFYLIGKLVYLSNVYNYTLVFGSLVKAGIPVSEALETSLGVVDNRYLRERLESININIGRGVSLSEAFEQTGLFEDMTIQMIRAGESSGQLDRMMAKVKDYYDMNFQNLIDNLSAYIEPIMIAIIAAMVLLLALGIFLPMWNLGQAVKN